METWQRRGATQMAVGAGGPGRGCWSHPYPTPPLFRSVSPSPPRPRQLPPINYSTPIKTPPPPHSPPPSPPTQLLSISSFLGFPCCLSSHLLPLHQYLRTPALAVVPPTKPHLSCRSLFLPFSSRNRVLWEGSFVRGSAELGAFPTRSWCQAE